MAFPRVPMLLALAALGLGLAACGDSKDEPVASGPSPESRPEDFPAVSGKTLAELTAGVPVGPALAPSVSVLRPGPNRFGFGLFDGAGKQMRGASVALYVAPAAGAPVKGPFAVRDESLAVRPQFASRQTAQDPDSAKSVYVAELPFPGRGTYRVVALARLDGRLVASGALPVKVGAPGPPEVGERAVRISTPTAGEVNDVAEIETRLPPDTMHEVDFADVLGRKPVVLVFATPQLCQSRVCGPVVDQVEQIKSRRGDDVAFVHMEIFRDNKLERGFRPQVGAWRLPSEPWVFAIDRSGRVAARFEGPASISELERGIDRAVKG